MTQRNKEIPLYHRLTVILRLLLKLLFISVALTIASLICTLSYPFLDSSLKDAVALLHSKPDHPPPLDVYLKHKKTERSKNKAHSEEREPAIRERVESLRQKRRDRADYDRLMGQYKNDIYYWNRAKNRWQTSLVLGFLGLSGVLFSLVLIRICDFSRSLGKIPESACPAVAPINPARKPTSLPSISVSARLMQKLNVTPLIVG